LSDLALLAAGGLGGFLIAKTASGQTVQIPVQNANMDTITCFDDVALASSKDYSFPLGYKGRIIAVWIQFYNTQALLNYQITIDDTPVLSSMKGSVSSGIALHNVAVLFPCNRTFDENATLKISVTNSDQSDDHLVRCAVITQKS
jgi:hypothetical protein